MTALCSCHFRIACELQDDDGKSGTLGNNILYLSCSYVVVPCADVAEAFVFYRDNNFIIVSHFATVVGETPGAELPGRR